MKRLVLLTALLSGIYLVLSGCGSSGGGTTVITTNTYSISGTIRSSSGNALQGVTVTLTGASNGTATTDANGAYMFTKLQNGDYVLTPALNGYTFSPPSSTQTINGDVVASVNFTGNPIPPPEGAWSQVYRGWSNDRFDALAIDSTGSGIVYAAAMSGVYKTVNGGTNWVRITDGAYMNYVAMHPTSPSTLYTGISSVMTSINGGDSWTELQSSPDAEVYSFAAVPNDNLTLYAGTDYGIFSSTDGGRSWYSNRIEDAIISLAVASKDVVYAAGFDGVYKTTDGGATWSIISGGTLTTWVNSVAVDPSDNRIVYAGAVDGFYKTTDGGASWTRKLSTNVTALAVARGVILVGTDKRGIYRSTDSGDSWITLNGGLTPTSGTDFVKVSSIAIAPTDSKVAYAGMKDRVYRLISQ